MRSRLNLKSSTTDKIHVSIVINLKKAQFLQYNQKNFQVKFIHFAASIGMENLMLEFMLTMYESVEEMGIACIIYVWTLKPQLIVFLII